MADTHTSGSDRPIGDVRVAVIGCGGWGKNLVRNFAELGALEAIVDPDAATAEALIAKHGGRHLPLGAALADERIDACVIAASAAMHADLATKALNAGKHVYVEKPLALDVSEAEALCALAERLDRRLMVGHLLQYHPAFLTLKEMVHEGKFGALKYIYSHRLNLGKIRREEDVMWSFAPHDISMILSLVGDEPDDIEAVGTCSLQEGIADVTMVHLGFPGGARAHVFTCWLHPFKQQSLVLVGEKGMVVFDDLEPWESKIMLYPHQVEWSADHSITKKADGIPHPLEPTEPLREECRHFLECVASNATPRTDGHEGLRVLRVLDKASRSLAPGQGNRGTALKVGPEPSSPRVYGAHDGVQIHETAYVDADVTIGEGTKIWHFSHILSDVEIGTQCNFGQNVVVGPRVRIGNTVKVQNNVSIYEGVTIEDGVFCGPSCVFTNVNNPRSEIARKSEYAETLVKRGATIGANATIVCGHTLGEYAFIAAGAVVASDVPDYALMAGVPARRIGWMSKAGARLGADLVCPLDGTKYQENGDGALVSS